jgi:hypothetical protein
MVHWPVLALFLNSSEIATANGGSNDVTIFQLAAGTLTNGTSYPLPVGTFLPLSLALSPDGVHLATADVGSSAFYGSQAITLFTRVGQITIDNATSYQLPDNSTNCVSVAFAPPTDGTTNTYLATANSHSNDVSLFTLFGQSASSGTTTTTTNSHLGIIVGTTVGAAVLLGVTITAAIRARFHAGRAICATGRAPVNTPIVAGPSAASHGF